MEISSGEHMEINWQWLLWQVGVPLGGPIVLSCLIVLLWQTGMPDFVPQWSIVLDASPWTLTFYTLALIGLGSLAQIFIAFLLVWRHNVAYTPNRNVYLCAVGMLLLAVALGHNAYLKSRRN